MEYLTHNPGGAEVHCQIEPATSTATRSECLAVTKC